MKLLYLSRWMPYPASNGSKLRNYNLIKRLAGQGHTLHLITFYGPGENLHTAIEHLKQFCVEVECVPYKPFQPSSWQAKAAFFALRPRSVIATFQTEMARRVEIALVSGTIQVVIANEIDMAAYGLRTKKYSIPALLEELETSTLYEQFRQAQKTKNRLRYGLTWFKLKTYIRHLARHYQAITVVSERERALVQSIVGQTQTLLQVLPNGADLATYQFRPYCAEERSNQLIFNGALTFNLNYEAMHYFLTEIFPLLRQTDPALKLLITGHTEGVALAQLTQGNHQNILFTGYVADLATLVAQSKVCIAPLLRGGGTRLKILEAFALGTPVVATTKGAEGLEAQSEEHLLIANTPSEFVQAILRLQRDPELAARLTKNARSLVERNFNWDIIALQLDRILHRLS